MNGGKPSYVTGGRVGLKERARAKAASMPASGGKDDVRAAKGPIQKPATGTQFGGK